MRYLNANINRTAATALVPAAALRAIAVAAAFIAALGFGGRIDSALNNGCGRLRLHLGHRLGYSFLRHGSRCNRHGWEWGYLHKLLPRNTVNMVLLLREYNQKILNHFVVNYKLDKSLILRLFNEIRGDKGLSLCVYPREP
jgi:hypothetical protein